MKSLKYLILFLIISLYSCEKPIQFNLAGTNMIVVNSLISSSDTIEVRLSKSIDISEKDTIIFLNDAKVRLYCDSIYIEDLSCKGDGIFKSGFIPVTGKEYSVIVASDNYGYVSSSTVIPSKPLLISAKADISQYNEFNQRVKITLKDDPSAKNFYLLSMQGYITEYDYTKIDSVTKNYVIIGDRFTDLLFINHDNIITGKENSTANETLEAILGTSEVGNDVINWIAFSDQAINGTEHTIETHLVDMNIIISKEKPIVVLLKSINEDYYKYLNSRYLADKSGNNPFTEPLKVYNNIKGGVGIFAAYNLAVDSIIKVDAN